MTTYQQRILGGLWGAIVGDALGVPVEFTSRDERKRDPVIDMRGYGTHIQPPGTWSDDASMLLCTVEALCEEEYHVEQLAALFLAWHDRGHWTPYGTVYDTGIATSMALTRLLRGVAPEEAGGIGRRDNGNGSLMRILPVALRYADLSTVEMLLMAHRISSITHRHPRCLMSCGLYCCMAKGLLAGQTPAQAYRYMIEQGEPFYTVEPYATELEHFDRLFSGDLAEAEEADIASSSYVVHTLEASIWSLLTTDSFESAVLKAVNLGDDADTTGCVTAGLAGVCYGMEAIPPAWIEILVRQAEIEKLLTRFTEELMTKHGKR